MTKRGIAAISGLVIFITFLILSVLNYCCASSEEYEPDTSIIEFDLSKKEILKITDFNSLIKEKLGKEFTKSMIKDENIIVKVDPSKVDLSDKTLNLEQCSAVQSVLVYREKSLNKDVLKLRLDCPFIVDIILDDE